MDLEKWNGQMETEQDSLNVSFKLQSNNRPEQQIENSNDQFFSDEEYSDQSEPLELYDEELEYEPDERFEFYNKNGEYCENWTTREDNDDIVDKTLKELKNKLDDVGWKTIVEIIVEEKGRMPSPKIIKRLRPKWITINSEDDDSHSSYSARDSSVDPEPTGESNQIFEDHKQMEKIEFKQHNDNIALKTSKQFQKQQRTLWQIIKSCSMFSLKMTFWLIFFAILYQFIVLQVSKN